MANIGLGLRDPRRKTVQINVEFDDITLAYINKLSKLTNHTISSCVTILLGIKILEKESKLKKRTTRTTKKK